MWMYPGPTCPDRSFPVELDDVEVIARVQRVLAQAVDQNSGPRLTPLREGVVSPWVSPLKLIPI
jgi:hypothetical protein